MPMWRAATSPRRRRSTTVSNAAATFDYDEASWGLAREFRARVDYDHIMLDVASAIAALRIHGRVGIVGFCVGGSAAWLAACRLDVDAAACYYPSDIGNHMP